MRNLKLWLLFLLIIGIAIFAMRALIHPGFYTSHDGWHQVARLYHFDQALADGQFPPRWSGRLLNGFGYPLFIFSYQMPWLIAEPLVLLNFSIFDSIKFVFLITYVFSGITMFIWIRKMWGNWAGFVASFIFLFTPYRFVNIFVRANIGEAVSFMFFPLIFWSLHKISQKKSIFPLIIGSLSIAGMLLSHIMVVFLFFIPALLLFLYYLRVTKQKKLFIGQTLLMGMLGFGLSAYYLLPAIVYKPITVFKDMYQGLYQNHFTSLTKLIYSPWGVSAIGTAGEMSRQVGIVIWISAGITILFIVWKLIRRTKLLFKDYFVCILLFGFFWSILLMQKISLPVWKIIESQALIDFPWRFLAVTTLFGSVLAGFVISNIRSKKILALVAFCFIFSSWYTNRNHQRVNQYTEIPLSLYIASETTTNTDDEYLPQWVSREQTKKEHPLIQIDGTILSKNQTTNSLLFEYEALKNQSVKVHHMYFPGWKGFLDNQPLLVNKSDYGGMQLNLLEGKHIVSLKYQPTSIMKIGEIITLISGLVCVILLLKKTKIKLL